MERLTGTRKFKNGRRLKKDWCTSYGAEAIEDTGLTPEEIIEMKENKLDDCSKEFLRTGW